MTPTMTPSGQLSVALTSFSDIEMAPPSPSRRPGKCDPPGSSHDTSCTSDCSARDLLALDRTFLAYVQTSLTIAFVGAVLAQIQSIGNTASPGDMTPQYARPLVGATAILAALVLFIGASRYFSVRRGLAKGLFPAGELAVTVIAVSLGTFIVASFSIVGVGNAFRQRGWTTEVSADSVQDFIITLP